MSHSTHLGFSCPPACIDRAVPPCEYCFVRCPVSSATGVPHHATASSNSFDRRGSRYLLACGPRWAPSRAVGVGHNLTAVLRLSPQCRFGLRPGPPSPSALVGVGHITTSSFIHEPGYFWFIDGASW